MDDVGVFAGLSGKKKVKFDRFIIKKRSWPFVFKNAFFCSSIFQFCHQNEVNTEHAGAVYCFK